MSNSREKEEIKVKEAKKNASDILSVLKEAISVKLHEMLDEESTFDLIDSDFIMDYMMLVASSREKTKDKIIEDLNFILNEKTEEFVNWYLDIWQKLSRVSTSKSLAKRGGGVAASLFQQVTNDLKRKYKDKIDPGPGSTSEQVERHVGEDVSIKMESDSSQSIENKKSVLRTPSEIEGEASSYAEKNAVNTTEDILPFYESIESSQDPTQQQEPVQSLRATEKEAPSSDNVQMGSKFAEYCNDYEEDVLVADTGDLNVSESSSEESDSMSLDRESTELKSNQISPKAKVNQWLKRRLDEDSTQLIKRQKLVSTVQMLEREPDSVRTNVPSIPSIIAPPPSNRCVVPSQILLRAMRDANKSTVSVPPSIERGSKSSKPTKTRSQEMQDEMEDTRIVITTMNTKPEDAEERQDQKETSQDLGEHSDGMSDISENDLEYYYENNDDLEYDSDADNAEQSGGLTDENRPRSPTFVVTMNKDHEEYIAAIQRPGVKTTQHSSQYESSDRRHSPPSGSNDDNPHKAPIDKRIVKVNVFNEYRTRAMSDEDRDMDTLENFKRFRGRFRDPRRGKYATLRHKRKLHASSESSEEEVQSKIYKTEPKDRDEPNLPVDKMKLDGKTGSEEHMVASPVFSNPGLTPPANNAISDYYSTMEDWIADPNHPMGLHLPPPMPLAPPPVMPPGFLPPPAIPPPMPPGFLPPPPQHVQNNRGNGYEINVKLPAQNNNNLITVQCQNLDATKKQKESPLKTSTPDTIPCKFHPHCVKPDCPFFHRTKCTTFPLCRFGKNCAYLHPPCKFAAACTRVDCVFDHSAVLKGKSTGTSVGNIPAPKNPTVPVRKTSTPSSMAPNTSDVCRFHPNCLNIACAFFHPKVCMYSSNCRNKSCVFFHPAQDLPSKTPEPGLLNKVNKFSLRRVNA